jgi:hypothetical protein
VAVYRSLRDQAAMLPHVAVAHIVDASGKIRASTRGYPATSVAAQDYFRYHRRHALGQPFLSAPGTRPGRRPLAVLCGQRLDDNHGQFAGVVVVGLACDSLSESFRTASLNGQAAIALYRQDLTLLARWPQLPAATGKLHRDSAAHQLLASGKQHDVVRTPDLHTGGDEPAGSLSAVRLLLTIRAAERQCRRGHPAAGWRPACT